MLSFRSSSVFNSLFHRTEPYIIRIQNLTPLNFKASFDIFMDPMSVGSKENVS